MSPTLTLATASRVLRQLRGDPRTMALMLAVPAVLLALLAWVYDFGPVVDRVGPVLMVVFPFVVMFVVTSIATLRERTTGTLERLMTTPLGRGDLIAGYALAFLLVAVLQTAVVLGAAALCGLDLAGPWWAVALTALASSQLGTALGLLASAFARTEFQAVQFMPAFVLPQFLLCGLLVPRGDLPDGLRQIAAVLPLSHAVDAASAARDQAEVTGDLWRPLGVLLAFTAAAVALGALTLPRRTD